VWQRCTDTPPPYTGEALTEARRGVHLAHLACMDTEIDAWQTPAAQAKLRTVAQVYEPGLPQTCRVPGLLWFFAVLLTGGADRLHTIVDACVRTCRATPGFEWELAGVLHLRANFLSNRAAWTGDATRDADESLEIFRRLGDAWGATEALAARGEANERKAAFDRAAADYRAAIEHAELLGARAQKAVLRARLGGVLLESGDSGHGERMLRGVIAGQDGALNEASTMARLHLSSWLALTDRTAEAREQLRVLREELPVARFVIFDSLLTCQEALVDALDRRTGPALAGARKALRLSAEPLSQALTPHLHSVCLAAAAMALADADGRTADAARCLGAAQALLPAGHVVAGVELRIRDLTEARIRARLDERSYEAAYAEGGGLSLAEATALI
jgi:tetratricopeptide (TPR) repeat protein